MGRKIRINSEVSIVHAITCGATGVRMRLSSPRHVREIIGAETAHGLGRNPGIWLWRLQKCSGHTRGLYPKLINSETTATFLGRVDESNPYSELVLKGVMIYDTKTGHLVGNQGYVSVDTPNPGEVARFGEYMARWIGTGGSSFF